MPKGMVEKTNGINTWDFRKKGEVMLPFGLRENVLVSVNDVERGLHKDVVCPSCKLPLVARKGKVKRPYFAHHNGNECLNGLQTALHMRAKEIIDEAKRIFVPGYSIKLPCFMRAREFDIITSQEIKLDDVRLEPRLGNIIPDIVAKAQGRELIIEIRVSHAVEEAKINLFKSMKLSAIEVDLSDLYAKGYDEDALRERLLEQNIRKKWLYSSKLHVVTENDIMSAIHRTCLKKSVGFPYSIFCPAKGGREIMYYDCYWCEYVYSGKVNPVREIWCGYNDKINDYDSLLQCLKRKKQQTGL